MSRFEAGFNLPPGCSPSDPRAPWNQDFPPGVEDVLGSIVMWPEGMDEDKLVPLLGRVTDFEEEEPDCEADEDGRPCWSGGGIRVEVTLLTGSGEIARRATVTAGHETVRDETIWVRLDELDHGIPEDVRPAIAAWDEAHRLEMKAQGERNRASNLLHNIGFQANLTARRSGNR